MKIHCLMALHIALEAMTTPSFALTIGQTPLTLPRGGGRGVNLRMTATTLSASDVAADDEDNSGEQTISAAAFNLIKGAVGSGVLSLPAGVAAIGDVPKALLPANCILFVLGTISAYTFHLLGRLTAVASNESKDSDAPVTSIGQLWDHEVGSSTSWLVSLAVMLTCFGTSLSYSIILGDTFKSLAETAGLTGIFASRRFSVAIVSLLGVYPLCCLKSLAALAPVSLVGVLGIFMTCIVMTIRALPGGAYSSTAAATATNFLASLPAELQPSFGVTGLRSLKSLLVLSSMTATSFLVHMTSPEFYQTLKGRTLARFGELSAVSFGGTALISAYMMGAGFLTFGGASKGMILNNYSALDGGATLCRLLMGISLLGSYAFQSNAMKKAYYGLFHKGQEVTDKVHYRTTRLFTGLLTGLALLISDAGLVVSLTGAVLGSGLIYILPSYLFLKSTKRRTDEGTLASSRTLKIERWWNRGLIGLGVFLALAGAWMSVVNSLFPHLL
ncbi:hypothetical protein ACHAXT_004917 [Thalassiosira profunda]